MWFTLFCFFWRDDWWYVQLFIEKNYSFISGVINEDIKPLYKYFYFAELYFFGKHFILYFIISILLFSLWICTSLTIFTHFVKNRKLHLLFFLILLFNPTHFINLYWIFQQCELLHLLFVNLYFWAVIRYVESSKNKFLLFSLLSLCIQHLVFPNGFFYPLLGVFYVLLFSKKKWYCLFNVLSILLLFSFYFYAQYLQIGNAVNIHILLASSYYTITYVASTIYRLLLIETHTVPFLLNILLTPILLISYIFTLYHADITRKKAIVFFTFWAVIASITVSFFRNENKEILFYYTSLNILPVLLALLHILEPYTSRLKKGFSTWHKAIILLYFVFATIEINYGKYLFLKRNRENYNALQNSINSNSSYNAYDEPFTSKNPVFAKYKDKEGGDALKQIYLDFK